MRKSFRSLLVAVALSVCSMSAFAIGTISDEGLYGKSFGSFEVGLAALTKITTAFEFDGLGSPTPADFGDKYVQASRSGAAGQPADIVVSRTMRYNGTLVASLGNPVNGKRQQYEVGW